MSSPTTPAQPAPTLSRDGLGRWAVGNPGGPGNPFARRTAELRRAFTDAITPEDLRALAQTVLEKARAGNMAAVKLALQYSLGKPASVVDPDTLDIKEIQLLRDSAVPPAVADDFMDQMPPALALPLIHHAWPCAAQLKADAIGAKLHEMDAAQERTARRNPAADRARAAKPTQVSPSAAGVRTPAPARTSPAANPVDPLPSESAAMPARNGHVPLVPAGAPSFAPSPGPLDNRENGGGVQGGTGSG